MPRSENGGGREPRTLGPGRGGGWAARLLRLREGGLWAGTPGSGGGRRSCARSLGPLDAPWVPDASVRGPLPPSSQQPAISAFQPQVRGGRGVPGRSGGPAPGAGGGAERAPRRAAGVRAAAAAAGAPVSPLLPPRGHGPRPRPSPIFGGRPGSWGRGRCRGAPISRRGVGVLRRSLAAPGEGQVALEGGGGGDPKHLGVPQPLRPTPWAWGIVYPLHGP